MRNSEKSKKKSLTTRIVVVSIGIFFLISCVNTVISIASVKKSTGDAMLESYTDLVKQAAHRAEEVILDSNNNTDEIQKFIEEQLSENKYMAYLVVIDTDAKAIAHTDTRKIDKSYTYDDYTVDAVKNGKIKNESYYAKDLDCWTYDIMVPINVDGQLYGVLDIGIYENKISDIINSLMVRQVISLIGGVILFAVIMNVIGKKLFSPLRDLADHCNILSKGDFSSYIQTEKFARNIEIDTIAMALDNMQKDFVSVIEDIDNSAENISSAVEELAENTRQTAQTADEISNAVGQIAEGATKQARDSEVGLRSIEELSTIVNDNKTHIEKLNEATVKVGKFKDEGILALKELVEANKRNNEEMERVNEIIVNTRESAEKIEVSSQMIMSISEQTNLLALNAAIEAARAGETGRGFAVVADEIRKLAEQSNEFTNEITKVIRELANKTTIGVTSMEEVKKSSEMQNESVILTTDKFEGIALAIEDVDKIIGVVSECSDKISNKNDDFVQIVNNLSVVSEENAASTEEVAASVQEQEASVSVISNACGELEKLAVNMKGEIEKFNY